ncbi:MAG: PA0069 family radical SAM protein [Phycisphaeraceae bacterium]|nr:PA0069 family radical SAM protein [Phycisphaeraceae bacterium]
MQESEHSRAKPDESMIEHDYRDALPRGPAHKRGAGLNPGNRFENKRVHVLGDAIDRQRLERQWAGEDGKPVVVPLTVYKDKTKKLINRVAPTSDVPFDWTVNPYRGCEHGCIYCFARPYHEYLGFSLGLDFETKLVAKFDAPELLARELRKPSWKGEPIVMSAITDIYQPIEKEHQIARRLLEQMVSCGQPVTTMTKNTLVLRDTELWASASAMNTGRVTVTLVTLDDVLASKLEPRATAPSGRLRIIRELVRAGVNVSVNIAPVIPGLTDKEMPAILDAVADLGVKRVAWVMLRLPHQLKGLFMDWLRREVPLRAGHVESLIRQVHGGKLYNSKQGQRGRGNGAIAAQIKQVFDVYSRRYGINRDVRPLRTDRFRRPRMDGQMGLF